MAFLGYYVPSVVYCPCAFSFDLILEYISVIHFHLNISVCLQKKKMIRERQPVLNSSTQRTKKICWSKLSMLNLAAQGRTTCHGGLVAVQKDAVVSYWFEAHPAKQKMERESWVLQVSECREAVVLPVIQVSIVSIPSRLHPTVTWQQPGMPGLL